MNLFIRIGKRIRKRIAKGFKNVIKLFKPVTEEEAEGDQWDDLLPPSKPEPSPHEPIPEPEPSPREPIPEPEPIPEEPKEPEPPTPIDWKEIVDAAVSRFLGVSDILIGTEQDLMSGNKMKKADRVELVSKVQYVRGLYTLFRKGMSMAQGGDILNTCEDLPFTPSATSQTFNNVYNRLVVIMTGDTAPDDLQGESDGWEETE